jgi:monoterpene epsilon-lactone hydrolase
MIRYKSSWTPSFTTIIGILRMSAKTLPSNVDIFRYFTNNEIPSWLPTMPKNICNEKFDIDFFSCEWIYSDEITNYKNHDKYILYIHGGAFCLCNTGTHKGLLFRMAKKTNCVILSVNYRTSPEHQFPIPLNDCLIAYTYLLGIVKDSNKIFIAGDSAGGNLAIQLMAEIIKYDLPKPFGLILISPWTDLTDNGKNLSWKNNGNHDYLTPTLSYFFAQQYIKDTNITLNDVSPLFISNLILKNFPRMLIEFGESEVLHDQIYQFCIKALNCQCDVQYNIRKDMVHVFPLYHFTGISQSKDFFTSVVNFINN